MNEIYGYKQKQFKKQWVSKPNDVDRCGPSSNLCVYGLIKEIIVCITMAQKLTCMSRL